jgi:3-hydroxybutyryl-CoA dehydrogenase
VQVRAVAVVGAGIRGRGIAQLAALGGYRTILEDLLPHALRRAQEEIRTHLDRSVDRGEVSAGEAGAAFGRLEYAGSVEDAAREADLVIEAVPEELESKLEIFTLLDKICRPHTILASNTSSLSITEIARVTYRAAKCVGMRFGDPDQKTRRLEIVRALETDEDTLTVALEVAKRMVGEAVIVEDLPAPRPAA